MKVILIWSELTLYYRMIMERYSNWTEWLAVQFSTVKSSLYLTKNYQGGKKRLMYSKNKKGNPYVNYYIMILGRCTPKPIPRDLVWYVQINNNWHLSTSRQTTRPKIIRDVHLWGQNHQTTTTKITTTIVNLRIPCSPTSVIM